MPQCTQPRIRDQPYGKGSLHAELLESTFSTRRRASRFNLGEATRLLSVTKLIDRNRNIEEERNSRVIARMRRTLEEIEAYKHVLDSYKSDKLQSLKFGYKPRPLKTPRSSRRHKFETRIYHSGYSMQTLKPEVLNMIEKNKPNNKKEELHKKLLEKSRIISNYLIDRKITNEGLKRERLLEEARNNALLIAPESEDPPPEEETKLPPADGRPLWSLPRFWKRL